MKRKIISVLLTVQFIISMIVNVSAEEINIDIPLDLSQRLNSKIFLQADEAGTVENPKSPDYFISTDGDKAVGLNKDVFDAGCEGDVLTYNGTEYIVKSDVNGNDSIYGNKFGSTFTVSENYYIGFKALAVTSADDTSNNGRIYIGFKFTDGTSQTMSIRPISHENTSETNKVLSTGTVSLDSETVTTENGNIYEYTVMVNDSNAGKKLKSVDIWSEAKCRARIIAITLIQSKAGALKKIEEDISSVISEENPSQEKILELKNYIELVEEHGVSADSIEGMEEFKELEKKFISVRDYSEKTDFDNIMLDINFTTPVAESSVTKENFKVSSNDTELDFEIEAIKAEEKITGVRVILENRLNYSDEIKVIVSKNVKNGEDENFLLGEDYEILFKPTAPTVYIDEVTVGRKETGADVSVKLINNDEAAEHGYALTVGIYTDEGEMRWRQMFCGTLTPDGEIVLDGTFEIDGDYSVECYLLNSFGEMQLLNYPVIK